MFAFPRAEQGYIRPPGFHDAPTAMVAYAASVSIPAAMKTRAGLKE
jgi:hypothetical protein